MADRIERLELWHVAVPLSEPFWPSWIPGYPQVHVAQTFARLTTRDGLVGVTAGASFTTERRGLGDLLGAFVIGMAPDDLAGARRRLREASYLGWRNQWLEAAFWDLKGKLAQKPVYKLLQEDERDVLTARVYASSGSILPWDQRRAWLDDVRRQGFGAVKIRVKDPERRDDAAILRKVREHVGKDFVVAVDANQGWPVSIVQPHPDWDLEYATRFGQECDGLGIAWIEEPLDMHDWDGMAELRRRVKTPIAGGEIHGAWHEIRPLFEHECLDRYQPDAMFSGLTVAARVMAECRARGLAFSPHTWSNGFNVVVNLHAFAAWEGRDWLEFPYEPPGLVPAVRDGYIGPFLPNPDGTLDVPQDPGLGVTVDERLLKRWGHCFHVSTPLRVAVRAVREKGLKAALAIKKNREAGGGA